MLKNNPQTSLKRISWKLFFFLIPIRFKVLEKSWYSVTKILLQKKLIETAREILFIDFRYMVAMKKTVPIRLIYLLQYDVVAEYLVKQCLLKRYLLFVNWNAYPTLDGPTVLTIHQKPVFIRYPCKTITAKYWCSNL